MALRPSGLRGRPRTSPLEELHSHDGQAAVRLVAELEPLLGVVPERAPGEGQIQAEQGDGREFLDERRMLDVQAEIAGLEVRIAGREMGRLIARLGRFADEREALQEQNEEEQERQRRGAPLPGIGAIRPAGPVLLASVRSGHRPAGLPSARRSSSGARAGRIYRTLPEASTAAMLG